MSSEVTRILDRVRIGDACAANELLPLVYGELRRLAAKRMSQEYPGQTLQATALVHEAYLRLVGGAAAHSGDAETGDNSPVWQDRAHFFMCASEAMRRILIEIARKRIRRGGPPRSLEDEPVASPGGLPSDDLLALDEALTQLMAVDPLKGQLVKLRYYGGLTMVEAAQCLGISRATADRYWAFSRAWLLERLGGGPAGQSGRLSQATVKPE